MSGSPLASRVGQDVLSRVLAIVLGGGQGQRLHPMTALRAKPAVPLLGRYRLVDIPLSQCIHSGIKRIFVLTQFNSASLNRHINTSYQFDTFSQGFVEIRAAEQTVESGDWFQGTADAVRQQLRYLRGSGADSYLILSGDQLYRMDYCELLATHLRTGADITVAALPVTAEAARGFGIMKVNKNGRIRKFVEKPSTDEALDGLITPPNVFDQHAIPREHGRDYLASMGLYVFRADVLEDIFRQNPEWIDFGKHVIPRSLRRRQVFAHLFDGFWEDIGSVRSYYEVHMRMVASNPPFSLYERGRIIYTHPRYLPGSRIQDARIRDCIVCEGSRIQRADLAKSVIGIRSVIQHDVKIDRSIVMGADYLEDTCNRDNTIPIGIGAHSSIAGAIIDKNARIGKGVVIRGLRKLKDRDEAAYSIRDGIVIIHKNAVIPNGTRIGQRA